MSTKIEWCNRPGTKGETWNPVVGCTKVSAGCKHCYAKTLHDKRHKAYLAGKMQGVPQYAHPFEKVQLMHDRLTLPLRWIQPRTVFVNSVSDLFHEDVPFDFIDQVFAVMALTPRHTYQILTKRPERMAEYFAGLNAAAEEHMRERNVERYTPAQVLNFRHLYRAHHRGGDIAAFPSAPWPLPNVWLGTSVENQATANERIPHLLRSPAAVRFLSCEPLLGPVDLTRIHGPGTTVPIHALNGGWGVPRNDGRPLRGHERMHVDWLICGGESGPGARPMHPDWPRALRDQCKAAGVPYFFKQWGAWAPGSSNGQGIVALNDATMEDYALGPSVCLKYGSAEWASLKPEVMHKAGKKASGNALDGRTHLEFPAATSAETTTAP